MSDQPRVILLTGAPAVGKSTLIQRLLTHLPNPAGFFTREVREGRARIGFEIVTLHGETVRLATRSTRRLYPREEKVGTYRVNLDAMDRVAVPTLRDALVSGRPICVDEIGPMEIFAPAFCDVIRDILNAAVPVIGTVVQRPYPFADDVKQHPRVDLYEVTRDNRDALYDQLVKLL